jgi:hypothetical protein
MGDDAEGPGADVVPARPSGASDVVPVRVGASPVGRARLHPVPSGLAGTSIAPAEQPWHPGLDLPPVGGAHQPLWDHTGLRYRKSVLTFGPVGRVLLTLSAVAVLLVMLSSSVFFLFPAVPLMFLIVPMLRDIWQRAPMQSPTPPGAASSATRGQSGSPR